MKTSHTTLIRGATFSRAGVGGRGGPGITVIVQW